MYIPGVSYPVPGTVPGVWPEVVGYPVPGTVPGVWPEVVSYPVPGAGGREQ